VYKSTIIL